MFELKPHAAESLTVATFLAHSTAVRVVGAATWWLAIVQQGLAIPLLLITCSAKRRRDHYAKNGAGSAGAMHGEVASCLF